MSREWYPMALPRDVSDPCAILVPKGEQKLEITFPACHVGRAMQAEPGDAGHKKVPGEWCGDWQGAA